MNKLYTLSNCFTPSTNLWGKIFVRHARKPIWLPPAKSKMYKIPKRVRLPEKEEKEILRLYNNYRNGKRLIRHYLYTEFYGKSATAQTALNEEEEYEKHRILMELNDQENERVSVQREERRKLNMENKLQSIEETVAKKAEFDELKRKEGLKLIEETQELVKTFIKREDFTKAIEAAIASPKDYNFAIDTEGRIYNGKRTRPSDVNVDELPKLEESLLGGANIWKHH